MKIRRKGERDDSSHVCLNVFVPISVQFHIITPESRFRVLDFDRQL